MADSQPPWENEHWVCSRYNFEPSLTVPPHPVALHDITVRDGEECADVAISVEGKVRIAEALAAVGVRRMELFLTVPGWLEVVRAIQRRNLALDLYVDWRADRTPKAVEEGVRHVMVWYRAGDDFQRYVLRRPREALLDEMAEAVAAARRLGAVVNLFMPESTRATLPHLRQAVERAKEAGASAFTVVDSLGVARPAAITFLVRQLREWTGLEGEVHCHNDLGLATANVLAAYEGGASGLHVAVNALGYRAGNAGLEEVAMALEVLYGVRTGLRLELLPWLSREVAEVTGIEPGYFKAVVGSGAFSYEQWGATAAFEEMGQRRMAFAYEPEVVGRQPRLVVGKWSDLGAVAAKLPRYGLSASPEQMEAILVACQMASIARARPLNEDEFLTIALENGARASGE